MKNSLQDIVKAISVLPFEIVKISGVDGDVKISSNTSGDKCGQVFLNGTLKTKTKDFEGVFGLKDVGMLIGLTHVDAFMAASAKINMKYLDKNGLKIPEEIVFEQQGFGKASYRLTSEAAIPKQMERNSEEMDWDVVINQPLISKVNDFAKLSGIYSNQESKFSIKIEDKNLVFMIGAENSATSKAQVTFVNDVVGSLKCPYSWNISGVLSVLKLGTNSDIALKVNNSGFLEITVETGIGNYSYLFLGSK